MKVGDLVRYNDIVGTIIRETTVEEQPVPNVHEQGGEDARTPLFYVVWNNGMEWSIRPTEKDMEIISEA